MGCVTLGSKIIDMYTVLSVIPELLL